MINKEHAEKEANALAKSLGKKWTPRVWKKSTGWHCCVVQGPLAVYPHKEGQFVCRLTDDPERTFDKVTVLSSTRLQNTPIEAVKAAVGTAKIVIRKMSKITQIADIILAESLHTHIPINFVYTPILRKSNGSRLETRS